MKLFLKSAFFINLLTIILLGVFALQMFFVGEDEFAVGISVMALVFVLILPSCSTKN